MPLLVSHWMLRNNIRYRIAAEVRNVRSSASTKAQIICNGRLINGTRAVSSQRAGIFNRAIPRGLFQNRSISHRASLFHFFLKITRHSSMYGWAIIAFKG